jgi:deoxyribodipyrimidine photolyase
MAEELQLGAWIYVIGGFVVVSLLLVFLWYRMQLNSKRIERELKILEAQYQDKVLESHRHFMMEQEGYIEQRLKELERKEKGLTDALISLEDENIKKLDKLLDKFEKKIVLLQEENEKENEKRIKAVHDRYEKKINELQSQKEKEVDTLKQERRAILGELEEYQRDLQEKSKAEMEKIRENYQKQMTNLQTENAKLLNEMQRMLEIKKKAEQPPPPLPRVFKRPNPGEAKQAQDSSRFSEETLYEIESQIQSTNEEMEKLKAQFSTMETKSKRDLQIAQEEIEELKMKIRHGEMKG